MILLSRINQFIKSMIGPTHDYPSNPDDYFKIAIFGSSAAAALSVERGFGSILYYELGNIDTKRIYLKNYAESGVTFYQYQVELAKAVADKYDLLIIFGGNNETIPYLYESKFFSKKNPLPNMLKRSLYYAKSNFGRNHKFKENFITVLSRVLFTRIINYFSTMRFKKPKNFENFFRCIHNEIEPIGFVPHGVWDAINNNFEKALTELTEYAQRHSVNIIICSLPTDETYPPFLSVFRDDITYNDKILFKKCYKKALSFFKKNKYSEAVTFFLMALKIDSNVSIANYYLGLCYRELNKKELSWQYLRKAINTCGFRLRYPDAFRNQSKDLSKRYNNAIFLDMIEVFHETIDNNIKEQVLFADCQHPSFLGHIIIAYKLLEKINQFISIKHIHFPINFTRQTLQSLGYFYTDKLNINPTEKKHLYFFNAQWHLSLISFVSCKQYCLKKAEKYFSLWFESMKDNISPYKLIEYQVYKAVIFANMQKFDEAVASLNAGIEVNKKYLLNLIKKTDWMGSNYSRLFLPKITFNSKENKFYCRT